MRTDSDETAIATVTGLHCWACGLKVRGSVKAWQTRHGPDFILAALAVLSKQEEKQDSSGIVSRNTNLVFKYNNGPARLLVQITYVREVPWQCRACDVATVVSPVVRQNRIEQSSH